EKTETKVSIDENLVEIEGEALNVWKAKDIITAIGRGFSPMNSFLLLEDEKYLEVINLKAYTHTKKSILRIKGRIIGKEGKCRKKIENMTNSKISVYGHTVSIIGDSEKIPEIKNAINMLIKGIKHEKVYGYLRRVKKYD
ncbi:MAG: RNA-processing protein, partial [Candidatus Aenigmarchaeota archaeon]|nr:RNA-processing protein [Candidatus Aenigmarchaeota archaeon]